MKKFDLKKWYTDRGMTQVYFAKLIGVHRETVRRMVNGESIKYIKIVQKFCELYDIHNARK